MRRLYAGPWIGEFGWELMGWQGVIRQFAPDFDKVIIIGQAGHEIIYSDFCTDFIPHGFSGLNPNMWMNDTFDYASPLRNKGDIFIRPQQMTLMPNPPQQVWHQYGKPEKKLAFDMVCHARSITKYDSGYINYPLEDWKKLIAESGAKSVVSIGTLDGSDHISGTIDMRGIPLEELMNVLASSKLLVGPSSGPMHLGALCGIPTLVWSGYKRSKARYEVDWNPLKTPVKVLSPPIGHPWDSKNAWQPELDHILKGIGETEWRN